jgi:hypothetical protein
MPDNSDLIPLFAAAGQRYGIDPTLLMAVAKQESGLNPNTPDSYQGAQGLMQLLPSTARGLGVTNPRDPTQAIPAAAAYLAQGYAATGTPEGAVMYYHGGPDTRQWGPKTKAYLPAVSAHYANMKKQEPDPYADSYKEFSGALQSPAASLPSAADKPPEATAPAPASGGDSHADIYRYYSGALGTPQKTDTPSSGESPEDAGQRSIAANVATPPTSTARGGDDTFVSRSLDAIKGARQLGPYIGGQIAQVLPQIATDASQGYDMAKAGIADIRAGNLAPSLPPGALALRPGEPTGGFGITPYVPPQPTSPSQFSPGGVLGTLAGAAGLVGSLVSGPVNKLIQEPVTQATGNPDIGARAGVVGNAILGPLAGKAVTGKLAYGSADPETLRLAQAADAWGIPIRNSQISNNPLVRKTDQMVGIIPGSGQASQRSAQVGAFTKAVSNTFGEDTPQITRTTLDQATKRIGGVMNDIEGRTTVRVDDPLINTLAKIDSDARQTFTPDNTQYKQIGAQIDDIVNRAAANGGSLPGNVYKSLIQRNSPLDSLANSSDGAIAMRAGQIKSALQDAMERSAAPDDAAAYSRARFQYKNMKTIEPLVTKGTPGEISPALLRGRVDANFDPRRAGPLGDLADIGQRFMRAPPDSGTPWGELVLNKLTSAPALLAGAAVGGVGGHFAGFNPMELAQGAAAAGAGALTARGVSASLNNPLYRAWLLRKAPGTGNELVNLP